MLEDALPPQCKIPCITVKAGDICTVECSVTRQAHHDVQAFKIQLQREETTQVWTLAYDGPGLQLSSGLRWSLQLEPHWMVRACASNRFGDGEWSMPNSLALQDRAANLSIQRQKKVGLASNLSALLHEKREQLIYASSDQSVKKADASQILRIA